MSQAIAEMVIRLSAEVAQLKAGLAEGQNAVNKSAKEMRQAMEQTKDSVDLLGNAIGVNLPKELKNVIAETQLIGPMLAGAFKGAIIIGFAQQIIELIPKIKAASLEVGGFTKEMQDLEKLMVKMNDDAIFKFDNSKSGRQILDSINHQIESLERAKNDASNTGNPLLPVNQTALRNAENTLTEAIARRIRIHAQLGTVVTAERREEEAAAKQRAADAKQHTADIKRQADAARRHADEVVKAIQQIGAVRAKTAKALGDPFAEIDARWQAERDKLIEMGVQFPETWEAIRSAELEIVKARNAEILAEYDKLAQGVMRAIGDMMPGAMPDIGQPTISKVKLEHDPWGAELDSIKNNPAIQGQMRDQVWLDTRTSAEKLQHEIDKLNATFGVGGVKDIDTYNRKLAELKSQLDENYIAWQNYGQQVGDIITQAALFGRSWEDAFKAMGIELAKLIIHLTVMKPLMDSMKAQGKGGGFWGGLVGGLFGGFRAGGGAVAGGTSYIVGEQGPELFTPSRSGFIMPSGSFGGGNAIQIVQHNDFRGTDASVIPQIEARMRQWSEMTVRRAKAEIRQDSIRRP